MCVGKYNRYIGLQEKKDKLHNLHLINCIFYRDNDIKSDTIHYSLSYVDRILT